MRRRQSEILPMRSEFHEQCAVIEYLRCRYPEILLVVSLAGNRMSMGLRMKSKRIGMSKGVPDLFIAEPQKGYHGLFIEMKTRVGGQISKIQEKWIAQANKLGYKAVVCHGAHEAYKAIEEYFGDGL